MFMVVQFLFGLCFAAVWKLFLQKKKISKFSGLLCKRKSFEKDTFQGPGGF
jgi:hypothetical protein